MRGNSSGDQSKAWIPSFSELDYVEYALYYIPIKFEDMKPYGGGAIQEIVVAEWS